MSAEVPAGETHFPLYAEDLTVSKRQVAGDRVQVSTIAREDSIFVDETTNHKRVQIDRIPTGRQVDAVPPVRQEGDTTILSVVEETVVVERRLILKEEIHIRRLHVSERHQEAVTRSASTRRRSPRPVQPRSRASRVSGQAFLAVRILPCTTAASRRAHRC